jgi:membrane protein
VATYAGLASVMIAIVFLYSLAAIFIFGSEFNAALRRARRAEVNKKGGTEVPPQMDNLTL